LIVQQAVVADDINTEFQQAYINNTTRRSIYAKEFEKNRKKKAVKFTRY